MLPSMLLCAMLPFLTADQPPPPNLEHPVDYVGWVNAQHDLGAKTNAAEMYQRAIDRFQDDEEASQVVKGAAGRPLFQAEQKQVAAWVEKNQESLALFAEAAEERSCYFKLAGTELGEVALTHLKPIRGIATLLAGRARLRLAVGDVDRAVEDVSILLRAAQHQMEQPLIIEHLVGIAMGALAYDVVLDIPAHKDLKVNYDDVIKSLRRADRPIPDMTHTLPGEIATVFDLLQATAQTGAGTSKVVRLRALPGWEGDNKPIELDKPQTIEEIAEGMRELYAKQAAIAHAGYAESRELAEAFDANVLAARPVSVFVASLSRADQLTRMVQAERNAARIVLRIHAIKAETGAWPADADAAFGADRAFRDDPFGDGTLKYRLQDGEPLLYSVWADGDDDGARKRAEKLDDDGDKVYWPRNGD